MSSGFDTHVSRLVAQLQTLRQIRKSASAPFFDQTIEPMSRIKRICEERERLSNSGLLNLRLSFYQSDSGFGQSEEKGDVNIVCAVEDDLSNSYTDIAYMLQSDYKASQPRTHELQESQQSQTELKRHVRQQSDARLQATFKLLSESIEEAGNLRALLEYSLEPEKIDILLANVDPTKSHTTSSHLSTDKENTTSPNRRYRKNSSSFDKNNMIEDADKSSVTRELKYRALLLEQGNLLDQLISVRTVLEEEHQRRVRAERDLSISIDVLNSTQVECDAMQQQLHDSQELNHTLTRSLQLTSPLRRQTIESHTSSDNSISDAPVIERADQDFDVNDNMDGPDSNSLALSLFDLSTTDANTDLTSTEHNTFDLFDTTVANNRENLRLPPSGSKLSRSGILGRSKNNNNNNNNQHVKNLYMQYLSEVERVEDAPPLPLDAPPTEEVDVQKDENVDTNSSYTGASSSASSNSGRKQKIDSHSTRKADKRIDLLGSFDSASHLPNHHSSSSTSSHKMVVDSNLLEELDGDPLDSQSIEDLNTETTAIQHIEANVPADSNAAGAITMDIEPGATKKKEVETNTDSRLRRCDLLGSLDDSSNNTISQEPALAQPSPTAIISAPSTTAAGTDDSKGVSLPNDSIKSDEENISAVMGDLDTQIVLDIDIGEGRKAEVIITPTSDPVELTVQLIVLHSLPGEYFTPLLDYISQTQKKLCEDIGAGIVVANPNPVAANNEVDLVDDPMTLSVQEANEFLSELDDINPSDVGEIVDIGEEDTLFFRSHSLSEEDSNSSHLSQEEEDIADSLTERSQLPDSNIMLALEDEFQEYLKTIGENFEDEEVSHSDDAINENAGEDLGLIELDQEPTPPSSPLTVPTTALLRSPPTVPNTIVRKSKSPASGVHFSPTVDTSQGTYLYAHYQSDSSDNGCTGEYDGDIYQGDGVELQVNTPMPTHRSPSSKHSTPTAQADHYPRYSPRSPRSPYSPRSPGGSKDITLTLPSSLQNITVALPRNVVDLTVNIPPNVQNITVTVPKRLSSKLSVSPKGSRSAGGTDRYGSRSGSSSADNSPLYSPAGKHTKDHSILGSSLTNATLSPLSESSAVNADAMFKVEFIAPATATSNLSPKGKSPSRPSETDVSREHRPHRKRKFFPSSLNVLSLVEAASNGADTGVEISSENTSPLPAKIGRQGVTPTHRKNTESSAPSTHLSSDTVDDSGPNATNIIGTISAPEGTASSFFKHALQVLEPEAVSPGRKPRFIPTAISITHESVSSEHSHQGVQQYSSVGEFCCPDAEGGHAHIDTGSTTTSSGITSEEPSHSRTNIVVDLVLLDAVVNNVTVLSPPRSFAAQVAQIEAHVHDLLSNPSTPTGLERVVDISSVEHRTVPAHTVHVVDELLDDFDLDNDDTSSSDGSINSSTHSPSDRMLAAAERFKAELPASPARGSRLFDRRAEALGSIDDLHSPAQEPNIESNTVSSLTASSARDVDVPDIVAGGVLSLGVHSPNVFMSVDDHPRVEYYDMEDKDGENDHVPSGHPRFIKEGDSVSVLIDAESVRSTRYTSPLLFPVPPVYDSMEQSPLPPLPPLVETEQYEEMQDELEDDVLPSLMSVADDGSIEEELEEYLEDFDSFNDDEQSQDSLVSSEEASVAPSSQECSKYDDLHYSQASPLAVQTPSRDAFISSSYATAPVHEDALALTQPTGVRSRNVGNRRDSDLLRSAHLPKGVTLIERVSVGAVDTSNHTSPINAGTVDATNKRFSLLQDDQFRDSLEAILGGERMEIHSSPAVAQATKDIPVEENFSKNEEFTPAYAGALRYIDGPHTDDRAFSSPHNLILGSPINTSYAHSTTGHTPYAMHINDEEYEVDDEELIAGAGAWLQNEYSQQDDSFDLPALRDHLSNTGLRIVSDRNLIHEDDHHGSGAPIEGYDYDDADSAPVPAVFEDSDYSVGDPDDHSVHIDGYYDDDVDPVPGTPVPVVVDDNEFSDRDTYGVDDIDSGSAHIDGYDNDDASPVPVLPVSEVIFDSDYSDREGNVDHGQSISDSDSVHVDDKSVPTPPVSVPKAIDDSDYSDREDDGDQSHGSSDIGSVHIDGYDYDDEDPAPPIPEEFNGNDYTEYDSYDCSENASKSVHIDGYNFADADPVPAFLPAPVPDWVDDSDHSYREGDNDDHWDDGSDNGSVHIDDYDYHDEAEPVPVTDVIDDNNYSDREGHADLGDDDSDSGSVHIDGYDYDDADPAPLLAPVSDVIEDSDYSDRDGDGDHSEGNSDGSSVHIDGYDYDDEDPASPAPDVIEDRSSDMDGDVDAAHSDDDSDNDSVHIVGYDYGNADLAQQVTDVIDDGGSSVNHSDNFGESDSGSVHIDGYDYDDAEPVIVPAPEEFNDYDYSYRESDDGTDRDRIHIDNYDYGNAILAPMRSLPRESAPFIARSAAVLDEGEFSDGGSGGHSDSGCSSGSVRIDGYDYDDADSAPPVLPVADGIDGSDDSDGEDRADLGDDDSDSGSSFHMDGNDYDDADPASQVPPIPEQFNDSDYSDRHSDDHSDDDSGSVHIEDYDYDDKVDPAPAQRVSDVVDVGDYSEEGNDSNVNSEHIEGYDYHGDVDPAPRGPVPEEFNDSDYSDWHSVGDDDSESGSSVHIDGYDYDGVDPAPAVPIPDVIEDSGYSEGNDVHSESDSNVNSEHVEGYAYHDDVVPAPCLPVPEELNDSDFSGKHSDGDDGSNSGSSVHIDGYDYDDADPALVSVADVIDASVCSDGVDEADHSGENSGDNYGEGSVHLEGYKFDDVDPALVLASPSFDVINDSDYSDEEGDNPVYSDSGSVHIDGYDYDDVDPAPGPEEFNDSDFSDRHSDDVSGSVHIVGYDYSDDADPTQALPVPDGIEDSEYSDKDADDIDSDSDSGGVHIYGYNYDDAVYPAPAPVPEVIDSRDFSDSVDGNDDQSDSDSGSVHIDGYDYENADPAPAPAALLPVPDVIHDSDYSDGFGEADDYSGDGSNSVHIDGYDYDDDVDPAPAPEEFNDSDFSDRHSDDDSDSDSLRIDGYNYDDDADPVPAPPVPDGIDDSIYYDREGDVNDHSDGNSDSRRVHIDGCDYDDAVPFLPQASDVIDDSDFSDRHSGGHGQISDPIDDDIDVGSVHINGHDYDDEADAEPVPPVPEEVNDSDFSDRHSVGDEYSDNESVHIDGYDYDDVDSASAVPVPDVINDSDYFVREDHADHSVESSDSGSVHIDGYNYDDQADPAPAVPAGEALNDSDYSDSKGNRDHRDDGIDSNSDSVHIEGNGYEQADQAPVTPMPAVFNDSDYSDREGDDYIDRNSDSGSVHIDGYNYNDTGLAPPVQAPDGFDDSDYSDRDGDGDHGDEDSDSDSAHIDGYDYDYVDPVPPQVPTMIDDSEFSYIGGYQGNDESESVSVPIEGYDYDDDLEPPVQTVPAPAVIDDSDYSDRHSVDDNDSDNDSVHIDGYEYDDADPAPPVPPVLEEFNDSDFSDGHSVDSRSVHIDGFDYDDDVVATPALLAPADFNVSDFTDKHSEGDDDSVNSVHIDGFDYDDDANPTPLQVPDVIDDSDFSDRHSDDDTEGGSVHIDGYDYDDGVDSAPAPHVPEVFNDSDFSDKHSEGDAQSDSDNGSVHIDGYDYYDVEPAPVPAPAALLPIPIVINVRDFYDKHSDEGSERGSVHIHGYDYDEADLILENSGYDSDCCPPTPVVDGATVHELEDSSLPILSVVEAVGGTESADEMSQCSAGFDLLDREVQGEDVNASELSVNDNSSVEGVDTPPLSPAPSADELDVPSYGAAIFHNSPKQGNRVHWSPTVKSSVSPCKHKKPAPPPLDASAVATTSMGEEEVEALSGYDSDCFVENINQDECRITVGDAMDQAEFDESLSNKTLSSGRRKSATIQSMRDLLLGGRGNAVGVPLQEDFPVDNIDKEVVREKAGLTERSRVQSRRDSDLLRSAVPVKGLPHTPQALQDVSDDPVSRLAPSVGTSSVTTTPSAQKSRFGARARPVFDVAGAFAAYEATIGDSPKPLFVDALSSPADSLCFSPASADENKDGGNDTVLDDVVSPYFAPPVPVSLWSADNLHETSFEEEQGHVLTLEDFLPVSTNKDELDSIHTSNSNKHTTNNLLFDSPVRQLNASLREISSVERIRLHRDAYYSIDSPIEVSFTNEAVGVILDVAAGVFDSANQLNNLGFTDQSAFLYENAMRLVQLTELDDLERDLQQEITLNLL